MTQARRLQDRVRRAERHINEVDSERQQYAAENVRLREVMLPLEKRIREVEGMVENLMHDAKVQQSSFAPREHDFNVATFRAQELDPTLTWLVDPSKSLSQQLETTELSHGCVTNFNSQSRTHAFAGSDRTVQRRSRAWCKDAQRTRATCVTPEGENRRLGEVLGVGRHVHFSLKACEPNALWESVALVQ